MDAKALHELAQSLFSKRSTLMSLWQEQASNFYPERADFTYQRTLGTDFASNLMTSYPIIVGRELADQLTTMLRPTAKAWFHNGTTDPQREDADAKKWLEWTSETMRRAMYDRRSWFTRATKEGDRDFSTFGQTVLSARLNRHADGLLFRCHHLRDCAWIENEEGEIGAVFRKWKPTCRDLYRMFKDKCHADTIANATTRNKPLEEVECMHMVVEADMYDDTAGGRPYWAITWDVAHSRLLEAVATWNREYVIPRWQTVSGSQYAFSPATVAGLPEARLIQAMAYTLLEAGEKVTNPPMVATIDAVRSDMAIYAGGTTWVDRDYDERMGDALRPMNIDAKGMPLGLEMLKDSRELLGEAFYLNKLQLPTHRPEMTAYEVGQYVAQYIRDAMPIFEPMEMSYNGALCEVIFDLMLRAGAFGSPMDMPPSLRGAEMQFRFESPLHDAIEQQKGQQFIQAQGLIAQAIQADPGAVSVLDWDTALRDALLGVQTPALWINSKASADEIRAAQAQAQAAQQQLAAAEQASNVAKNIGDASNSLSQSDVAAPSPPRTNPQPLDALAA